MLALQVHPRRTRLLIATFCLAATDLSGPDDEADVVGKEFKLKKMVVMLTLQVES